MITSNVANDSNFYPQTEEDRIISEAKVAAFNEIQSWIENVTNQRFSHPDDFRRSLSDGCLLCNLLNCLKPGSIKRINRISTPIAGYDNIGKFLRCCEEAFGLRNVILFQTSDLEDLSDRPTDLTSESDRRLQRVLICLFHLAKSVENQLTNVVLDPGPFRILLQSQDHREMRRLKSNSISSDSSHEINVTKLIQNQTADYLAAKANETLTITKANQEVLHRSSNDEEWQESLENWKEKRRQVISSSALDDSKEERNVDNNELLELKERARKMKLLRDQLKDQSIVSVSKDVEQIENGDSKAILNIDDETMAMIERVKQKKLAEENKRKFNISPQLSATFASDSEQSTSTALDKHEDDTQSISEPAEKNEVFEGLHHTPEIIPSPDVSANNHSAPVNNEKSTAEDAKTRLVNIKLTNRSQQDTGQLWGLDVTDGKNVVLVSKVKIGSCADVCDVRKGDEIVSINSEDIANKSAHNIRSILSNCQSVISGSDVVTLCLRRTVNADEEAEFFSDQSEEEEEDSNRHNTIPYWNQTGKATELQEHEINYQITELECADSGQNSVADKICTVDDNVVSVDRENTQLLPDKFQEVQLLVENFFDPKDESTCHMVTNLLFTKPDVPNSQSEAPGQLSVQDKITKIESESAVKTMRLSSSWNIPKTSSTDPLFSKSSLTKPMGQSIDRLCWNSDNFKYRQFGSGNSSLSNLYHYWETEAPKSVSSSQANKITKSAPVIQVPIRSTVSDRDKSAGIDLEIAEQQQDTFDGQLEQTWRNVHSSGNSSTSDDVSALNETIILPQYKAPDFNTQVGDKPLSMSEDNVTKNSLDSHQLSNPVTSTSSAPVLNTTPPVVSSHPPKTNASTGIQADLIQCRRPTNYTNITTSFKSRYNKSNSYPSSQLSDDETCSITLSNAQDFHNDNGPSSPESKESYCINMPPPDILNVNDMSKDYTTVTAVTQPNEIPRKFGAHTSMSMESSITGVSDNNEKSVEIEVSVTPQLFPIRNRTLIPKHSEDKYLTSKSNDISTLSNCSYAEDITLQSDFVKVTDLDDVISPVKHQPRSTVNKDHSDGQPSANDNRNMPNAMHHTNINTRQPNVKMRRKHLKTNSVELPKENGQEDSSRTIYSYNKSHSLLATVETDQSISTLPVPTLFKSGPKSDNTLSQSQISSRSDSGKSKKLESILSSKKLKKCNPGDSNTLSESKRSSSTKELRFKELPDDKEWNLASSDNSKRTSSYRNEDLHGSSNNTKYSTPETFQKDILPETSNTKSHTKSYSIERTTKNVSSNSNGNKKAPKKTITTNCNEAKVSMKCNYCGAFVGLEEDLMVIEELKLHFHLKCFICNECQRPLGDGKSDTDVRIRRSKLHCMACYQQKSSKSKHRLSSTLDRPSRSTGNVSQNKETEI